MAAAAFDSTDRRMMARALELAARARGRTAPNPLVGAVVYRYGEVLGEGYHHRAGEPHAEVLALRRAGESTRGATLAVSLEPCCHWGRTPPCVEAVLGAGVARVVVAMQDPNPQVRGKGIAALRRQGVRVEVGLLGAEARRLNEVFIHWITVRRPFVALKLAQSLDGAIALGADARTAITSGLSLRHGHALRSWHDAVLVGVGTVLADDPLLNVRYGRARELAAGRPWRVVLDSALRLPESSRLVATVGRHPLLVLFDPARAPADKAGRLRAAGVELQPVAPGGAGSPLAPSSVLEALGARGITSVLIEGGRQVATAFLRERLVSRLHLFLAPLVMGEGAPLHGLGELGLDERTGPLRLTGLERHELGPDLYLTGRIAYPAG